MLPRLFRRLSGGGPGRQAFVHGALSLGVGSAVGQFIVIVSAPILARLYSPEAYGSLGLVATISSVFFVVAAGRYELAIVLPRRAETAGLLLRLGLTLVAGTALLAAASVLLLRDVLAAVFRNPSLESLLWWVPVSVGAMGAYEVLNMWLTRHARFRSIAGARITRSAGTVGAQLGLTLVGGGGLGLVIGQSLGQVAAAVFMWAGGRRIMRAYGRLHRTTRRLLIVAHRYRDFPRFSAPQAVLDAGSQQLPVFVLGAMFGPAPVGLFWFTNRLLQLATELFGQSIRQVFHQQVTEKIRARQPVDRMFRLITVGLLAASLVPALILVFWGPDLFSFVFGGEWREAGTYARWLAVSWVGAMAMQPSIAMVFTLELQKGQLLIEMLLLVGRVVAMLGGAAIAGAVGVVAGYALATAVAALGLILWVGMTVRRASPSVAPGPSGA